jgi:hypothetical protein
VDPFYTASWPGFWRDVGADAEDGGVSRAVRYIGARESVLGDVACMDARWNERRPDMHGTTKAFPTHTRPWHLSDAVSNLQSRSVVEQMPENTDKKPESTVMDILSKLALVSCKATFEMLLLRLL